MSDQQQAKPSAPDINYFSFWQKIAHAFPGLVTLLAFVFLKPIVAQAGYPPLMAFTLAVLCFDIPLLISILFFQGWKLNQRLSLKGVLRNLERTKAGKFLGIVLIGILLALGLFALSSPIERFLNNLFSNWLPEWMFLEKQSQYAAYSRSILMRTIIFWTVVTGILLPIVEEFYFRSYLLPRMSSIRINAVVANALVFALYHFWHPYGMLTFFLQGLLFAVFVLWYRNIRLSITWHIIGNLQLRLMILISLLYT